MEDKSRNHLSAPGLLSGIRTTFKDVPDHRSGQLKIKLADTLMSGLAVFGLKFPSLLQFDQDKNEETTRHNLKTLYGIDQAPCDTQMREILDPVDPMHIKPAFKKIISKIQTGGKLEEYQYIDGYHLISVDGTGHLSSNKIHCDQCCEKHRKNGDVTYYHQLVAAVIVHPDKKTVIPFAPEPINKQDGNKKNDCERNASKRLLEHIREENPKLKIIVVEDALAANGPHIKFLKSLKIKFIISVKPGDHKYLL